MRALLLRTLCRIGSRVANVYRQSFLRAAYPNIHIEEGVSIGRACRIRASDGGILTLGAHTAIDPGCEITAKAGQLKIGCNSFIGRGSVIVCRAAITIGEHALIAEYVTIRDQDHRCAAGRPRSEGGFETSPIIIGNNVWIGAKATITRGVVIGSGSIIGAGAVVTRDLPDNVVAVGVPARVVRQIETLSIEDCIGPTTNPNSSP
ncbi:MAG: hypothetical protein KatS3mg111_3077 [Pirellulaceae bacterium]|nr:MAG: hypothetical protein KatS3mg111_3077 [Pirellulaceae bacterium]